MILGTEEKIMIEYLFNHDFFLRPQNHFVFLLHFFTICNKIKSRKLKNKEKKQKTKNKMSKTFLTLLPKKDKNHEGQVVK